MFLDDKLLEICKNSNLETTEDIQRLNKKIVSECSDYYIPKINQNLTNKDVKTILDKTFNLFDSFVRSLQKSKDEKLIILAKLFKEHTFNKQLLSNRKLRDIYDGL